MARSIGVVKTTIWQDDDFRTLTVAEQRLYVLLLSQPKINNCGVLPLTVRKWARYAVDDSAGAIERGLEVLGDQRFVVVDYDSDEVLVRTFIRHDKIADQPRLLAAAIREFGEIESSIIRAALRREYPDIFKDIRDPRPPGQQALPEPLAEPLAEGVGEGVAEGDNARARGRAGAPPPLPQPPSPSPAVARNVSAETPREADDNGLPFEKELSISRLLTAIGPDADDQTPSVVRSFAGQLSLAALQKVTESLDLKRPDNRAAYAVAALKSELEDAAA